MGEQCGTIVRHNGSGYSSQTVRVRSQKLAMTKAKDTGKVIADTAHRDAIVKLAAAAYSEHFKTQYFEVADALDKIGGFVSDH